MAPSLKTDSFTCIVPSKTDIASPESTIISSTATTTTDGNNSNDNTTTIYEKLKSGSNATRDMVKTAVVNVSFVQPFFAAKSTFDLLKKTNCY